MMKEHSVRRRSPITLRLVLMLLSLALLAMAGCGGRGDQVETDPGAGLEPGLSEPVEDVELGEDPMAGSGLGGEGVREEDVEPAVPAVVLQDVFFDFDEYGLGAEALERLAANGRLLQENPTVRIRIEGHCDERGTVQYNLALGEKRANAARDYLLSLGVDRGRIETVSYGKERPFVLGHDESAWSQNRRAHFVPQPPVGSER